MRQTGITHSHSVGITRRELVQAGYSGLLGIGLPSLFARQAMAKPAQPLDRGPKREGKSVIFIFASSEETVGELRHG